MEAKTEQSKINFSRPSDSTLLVELTGTWRIGQNLPAAATVKQQVETWPEIKQVAFNTEALAYWDSSLITFLMKIIADCLRHKIQVDKNGLPKGVKGLISLATAVPEKKDAQQQTQRKSFLEKIGGQMIDFVHSTGEMMAFLGEAFVAIINILTGKGRFRPVDLGLFLQECGAQALPIVSLISLLVGLILAFVGIIQLKLFGAQIYVADLVGIGMVREMGAIMAGIVMAGRTGAAFAAQLGTMQVNEEIDALQTLGINPMEFLVMPRMVALTFMMPLLCLYANLMGFIGGALVAVGIYDVNLTTYFDRTKQAIGLNDLVIGLFMSLVFGILVALAGCLRGMQCGRSASAVGDAATSAVVTGIVAIIVATSIITVLCDVIGI